MAIVTPGKRPCDRIAQSKAFGKKFVRAKRGVYAALTLTSLVDVMTIIVIFLLMNFSANGEVLYMSKDIKLPDAYHGAELERAPVISLSAATQVIAAGDLSARVPPLGGDELGRLCASFNAMAERIERDDAALRRSRHELERRVEERTSALMQASHVEAKARRSLETRSATVP